MQQNPKTLIIEVLTLIGYEENKEAYATAFIQNCEKQALLDLLTALPQEKQSELKQRLGGVTDLAQQKVILFEYITLEQYTTALQNASQTAFEGLMEEILPTLSTEQADRLQAYLQSLTPLNAPANI